MRVLLLSPSPPPIGGITRWTMIVLAALSGDPECEIRHVNISPKYKGKVTIGKRVLFGFAGLFSALRAERSELRWQADVLHITSSGSLALIRDILALRLSNAYGVPSVYHIHFGRIPEIRTANKLTWKLFTKVFSLCDAIIAIDEKTKQTLDASGYGSKCFFCPNPVDLQSMRPSEAEKEKKIVFLGHVLREKGICELISAWLRLSPSFPDYSLEIIGRPNSREFLESLPKDETIHLLGELPHSEAMAALSKAAVLVLPSYTEGFPNVILEAMALRVPVIATNVGNIPDMLSGGAGVIIEPKSTEQLYSALNELLSSRAMRDEMAGKAYRKAVENYSADMVVKQYKAIWERVKK